MTRLLVPMTVEALVVGKPDPVAAISPKFNLMSFGITLGTGIEPQPFETTINMPPGVHLRWALADSLAHGVQGQAVAVAVLSAASVSSVNILNPGFGYDPARPPLVTFSGGGGIGAAARAVVGADGTVTSVQLLDGGAGYDAPPTVEIGSSEEIRYPKIPNRWFICRSHAEDTTRKVTMKTWVVVSDTLSDNAYGRLVEGTLPLSFQSQLTAGPISPALRDALNAIGVPVTANATVEPAREVSNIWYIFDTKQYYSIEVRTNDLLVLGNEAVSWPRISEPDPFEVYPPYKYLGRSWPYPMWDGASPPLAENRLTAIGPGDPTFAAAYPNSRSVLGFYDDLIDLPAGEITYMVAGWYANPADNPLYGKDTPEKWAEAMDEQRWCIKQDPGGYPPTSICGDTDPGSEAAAAADLPQDVLLQGMVYAIPWTGPNTQYPSGVPVGKPDIAVGNTSAEALSALVAAKMSDPSIEEILEAFMYDLIDLLQQPDGVVQLEQAFHAKMFGNRPSETIWGVAEKQTESAEVRKDQTLGTPFPPEVSAALSRTNDLQSAYDRKNAELRSLQWETYSAWFRKAMLDQSPLSPLRKEMFARFEAPPPRRREQQPEDAGAAAAAPPITIAQIKVVIDRLIILVNAAKAELATLATDLDASIANLIAKVAEKMPGYEVTRNAGRSYWQSNDPVVLFAGDGVVRTFAFGEDAALADGESLPCRVTGQTITALTTPVPGHPNQTITQTQLQQWYGSLPSGVPIPAEIQPLFIETLLLDTTMDYLMAISAWKLAGVPSPTDPQIAEVAANIQAIQTAPLNAFLHFSKRALLSVTAQTLAEEAGLTGVYPYKLAVDPWSQPWAPIYLEWDVIWAASAKEPRELAFCDTPSPSCSQKWMFDEADFQWNTKFTPAVPTDPRYAYTGRTVITPQAPDQLASKIQDYLRTHPDSPYYKQLEAAYEVVRNLQVLSQNMSGFAYSLTQRRETLQLPVIDYFDRALGQRVAAAIGAQNQFSPLPDNGYSPLRGGHTRLVRLWVVDSFGQAQRVIDEGQTYNPILSTPLITSGNPALIQLVPRIVQPSRLDMNWIDATDDGRICTSDPATSPICGWIIPNYFDNSIMVYDSIGGPIGALQLLDGAFGEDASGVRWLETPGTDSAVGAQPSLDNPDLNPHLKGFVNGILQFGAEGRMALSDLIVTLHDTLSTIVISGSAANYGNLPVLIGRPMALVRSAFRIDLDGLPDYDESWVALKTFYDTKGPKDPFTTGGFIDVPFPVRIGDVRQMRDGAIGYYDGSDYSKFNSKLIEKPQTQSSYIQFEQRLHLKADPSAPPQYVTIVVDPRAPVHVVSDFVPQIAATLPPAGISEALQAMDITFRVGPLINDANVVSLPMPADVHGNWSWLYHPNVTMWSDAETIQSDDAIARFTQGARHINEGWLKLSDAIQPKQDPAKRRT